MNDSSMRQTILIAEDNDEGGHHMREALDRYQLEIKSNSSKRLSNVSSQTESKRKTIILTEANKFPQFKASREAEVIMK
jgi:hypothetical protein